MLASRTKMTGIHRAEDGCMQVAAVKRAATPRTGRSALCLAEDAALFRSVQKFAPVGSPPGAPGLAYQAVRAKGSASGPHERESGDDHALPDTGAGCWREARSPRRPSKAGQRVKNLTIEE